MNILVTVDQHELHPLAVMAGSLLAQTEEQVSLYVMEEKLTETDFSDLRTSLHNDRLSIIDIRVTDRPLTKAPTSHRYPMEIYDRLFAAEYLPKNLDRILYLDPDVVVLHNIDAFYHMDFQGSLYAAASHVGPIGTLFNDIRVGVRPGTPYINSGVLLINLEELRKQQDADRICRYIRRHGAFMCLPDQDVLTALYGDQIQHVPARTINMTPRIYYRDCVLQGARKASERLEQDTCILHYVGRNKPWKQSSRRKQKSLDRIHQGTDTENPRSTVLDPAGCWFEAESHLAERKQKVLPEEEFLQNEE